jgi:tRNA (guanine-N7-)-methyltransferase
MLNPDRLAAMSQLLKPGGSLRYKTDHENYFSDVVRSLETSPEWALNAVSRDLYASPFIEGNIQTEFEQLFLSQKLPIYFLEAVRA